MPPFPLPYKAEKGEGTEAVASSFEMTKTEKGVNGNKTGTDEMGIAVTERDVPEGDVAKGGPSPFHKRLPIHAPSSLMDSGWMETNLMEARWDEKRQSIGGEPTPWAMSDGEAGSYPHPPLLSRAPFPRHCCWVTMGWLPDSVLF